MIRDNLVSPRLSIIALMAILATGATACGSSSNSTTIPTSSSVESATPAPAATAIARPDPGYTIVGNTYTFTKKGYAVTAPDGWEVQPNIAFDVAGAAFAMDAWVLRDPADGDVQPIISMVCLKPRADQATTEEFRDAWKALVLQLAQTEVTPTSVSVAGQPAFAFDYPQSQGADVSTSDRTDIIFVAAGCRWRLTLVAPAERRAAYMEAFEQFTSSFLLLTN